MNILLAMKIDASDAATGLPAMRPLGPDAEPTAIVLAGDHAGKDIVRIPGTDEAVAVTIIYLRGVLLNRDSDEQVWIQRPLAIPTELVPAVIAALKAT